MTGYGRCRPCAGVVRTASTRVCGDSRSNPSAYRHLPQLEYNLPFSPSNAGYPHHIADLTITYFRAPILGDTTRKHIYTSCSISYTLSQSLVGAHREDLDRHMPSAAYASYAIAPSIALVDVVIAASSPSFWSTTQRSTSWPKDNF